MLEKRSADMYSALIGSIFLNLHFASFLCDVYILGTSFSLSVYGRYTRSETKKDMRAKAWKGKKKRQLNSNSSLYGDKKILLTYQDRHCYWMIFRTCTHTHTWRLYDEPYVRRPLLWLRGNPKHFSIALSASSTLVCHGSEKTYVHIPIGIDTVRKALIIILQHAASEKEGEALVNIFFTLIPSFRPSWYRILNILLNIIRLVSRNNSFPCSSV